MSNIELLPLPVNASVASVIQRASLLDDIESILIIYTKDGSVGLLESAQPIYEAIGLLETVKQFRINEMLNNK